MLFGMAVSTRLMALDEFLRLPEAKPYLELIDGEVCQKPVAKLEHSRPQRRLLRFLEQDPATRAGEAMPELGLPFPGARPGNHRVPDISYYRAGRRLPASGYPEEPPDLAVEIRSEGQTLESQAERLRFLRERGVAATLLVDPAQGRVYVHDGDRETIAVAGEEVILTTLDGFSFRVDDLFGPEPSVPDAP
jgi:Uma2 family endonuclease